MELIIFILGYIFLTLSILGYGRFACSYILKTPDLGIGHSGILGIFIITIIIYFFNFFFKISIVFNSILHIIGFIIFIFNYHNYFKKPNHKETLIFWSFIILFIIFLLSAKPHDDFQYYHFAYIHNLNNEVSSFGIGNFNHGFRTHSSIFYFASSFYLPFIEYRLIHSGAIFYILFANLILIKKIFLKPETSNYINFISLLSFAFINIIFYRMAEHGTDRSAQILILILIIEILERINTSFSKKDECIFNIMVIFSLIISLKAFYSIYLILLFPIFALENKRTEFLKYCLYSKSFIASSALVLVFYTTNFVNTGCFIYPLNVTCLDFFTWSIPITEVNQMKEWYELWSKAGATPNTRVDNPNLYITSFNWVANWLEIYFFNKVSDFLLGILTIFLVSTFIFYNNKKTFDTSSKKEFLVIYIFLLLLTIEWFINHPSLRYGGFSLFALLIFMPGAMILCIFRNNAKIFFIKKITFVILVILIFIGRNVHRLNSEIKLYNYDFIKYPSYEIKFNNFEIYKNMNEIKNICKFESPECNSSNIKHKKNYNRSIYYK